MRTRPPNKGSIPPSGASPPRNTRIISAQELHARAKLITAAANPLIKDFKALERKKERAEQGLFICEGARHLIEAGLAQTWPVYALFAPEALERETNCEYLADALDHGTRLIETSADVLGQIARRDNAQNLIGVFRTFDLDTAALTIPPDKCLVALHRVRDPGNFGTIVRTADATGAAGIVLVDECCDPFAPEAVRASMGSMFALPIARATTEDLFALAKKNGAPVIGAALGAQTSLPGLDLAPPLVLLMGNEQSGLPPDVQAACDGLIELPMRGRADSLNLAVATAVCLYEIWRRRDYAGHR